MIKILNLNIWNYNQFEDRKPIIIELIRKHDPDVIVFQEIRDDLRFNKKGNNQAKQLNEELNYKYLTFYAVTDKRKERSEKYNLPCFEGTAVLSKFKIIKVDKVLLKKHKDDIYSCGNLYFKIKAEKEIEFIAVHFSPNKLFSKLHLIETLRYIKENDIEPIILGDFNIIDYEVLYDLTYKNYLNSMQIEKYVSYPKGNLTLDYILIPKKYRFESFECSNTKISDHKALIAKIVI